MVRRLTYWVHEPSDYRHRKKGEPKFLLTRIRCKPGRQSERRALLRAIRRMYGIRGPPLRLRRIGPHRGRLYRHDVHYFGLLSAEYFNERTQTHCSWLVYAFVGAQEPWQLQYPKDYRVVTQ